MSSVFNFSVDNDVVQSVDFEGYEPVQTGLYRLHIKTAFGDQSASGARFVRLEGDLIPEGHDGKGGTIRQDVYFMGKNGKLTYERNGKQMKIPGLDLMDAMCEFINGKGLSRQAHEEKLVDVFIDGEKQQAKRDVLVDIVGSEVLVAVERVIDNKSKQNSNTGEWEPTAETRQFNEIVKVFSDKGFTYAETLAAATETKWKTNFEKSTGKDRDRTKKVTASASQAPGNKPSLGGTGNQAPPARVL